MDTNELKKRAGIVQERKLDVIEHVANNYINGNISDVMHTLQNRMQLLAKVALYLNMHSGQREMTRFLKTIARYEG